MSIDESGSKTQKEEHEFYFAIGTSSLTIRRTVGG